VGRSEEMVYIERNREVVVEVVEVALPEADVDRGAGFSIIIW
jgi:hypothetical protein